MTIAVERGNTKEPPKEIPPQLRARMTVVVSDGPGSTIVLWVSREHAPLEAEIEYLRRKLGRVMLLWLPGRVPNAEFVDQVARAVRARYVIPLLPLSFIQYLAGIEDRPYEILFAEMERIYEGRDIHVADALVEEKPDSRVRITYADGTVKVFEFRCFRKLKEVKVITEEW